MDYRKHALILAVIERLRQHGSWTGKTHLQKALFVLAELTQVPVPFRFVLYKHGPYSFDLEDELEEMRSYSAVASATVQTGYGVVLKPGRNSAFVKQHGEVSGEDEQTIDRVAQFLGTKNVAELERLASVVWIRSREGIEDPRKIAERLHELKPHVSLVEAEDAVTAVAPLFGAGPVSLGSS